MKTAYYHINHAPGYGPRIFVPYAYELEAKALLDPLSCWGGSDKDTGIAKGWEFGQVHLSTALASAIITLREAGFCVAELDDSNHREVWK